MFKRSDRKSRPPQGGEKDLDYQIRNASTEELFALARSHLNAREGMRGIETAERILDEVRDRYGDRRRRDRD